MGYLLLAAAVAGIWICLYIFRVCFYSPKNRKEDPYAAMEGDQYVAVADVISASIRVMDKTPWQWVQIKSYDGLTLWGRYFFVGKDRPTMLVFHGYRGNALRDGAGAFAIGRQLNFNVLIPDQRSHARSDGQVITFGIRERTDVCSWAEWLGKDAPIVLAGLSMGAATVLMAADQPLSDNVVGILADCPYDSPGGIIQKVCKDMKIPSTLAYPFVKLTAYLCGFSLEGASAAEAVNGAKVPILLMHGLDDRFVPAKMSEHIAAQCAGPVRLELFPDAGHGLCYVTDPIRYETAVKEFLGGISALEPYLQ